MQHKSATVLAAVRAAVVQVEGDDGAAARHKSYDSAIKKTPTHRVCEVVETEQELLLGNVY